MRVNWQVMVGRAPWPAACPALLAVLSAMLLLHRLSAPQGDIENVAQMQPRDLTLLFEHISGSAAHRGEYEELEKKKAEAEERVTYIFSRKKAITQGGWEVGDAHVRVGGGCGGCGGWVDGRMPVQPPYPQP